MRVWKKGLVIFFHLLPGLGSSSSKRKITSADCALTIRNLTKLQSRTVIHFCLPQNFSRVSAQPQSSPSRIYLVPTTWSITAFQMRFGHFEYLCNAPATFQHFVNYIIMEYLDLFSDHVSGLYLNLFSLVRIAPSQREKVLPTPRLHGLYTKTRKMRV